jgi:hypothetical protein
MQKDAADAKRAKATGATPTLTGGPHLRNDGTALKKK